ncbi:methyltransferase domain-containing protein [Micromonospora sp. NPDC049060]|uniref:class I SAM-dependent methyltransferase n=1 Tax=Micromonospora sp. NPDC049060 TaxID=3154828 RepID=UPI0033E3170E
MKASFSGEVATYYARHRRGYPPEALDALVGAFGLSAEDTVVDLGCGTAQLSLPLAARVGTVIGVDPEPDMLVLARQAALDAATVNTVWMLGTDNDLPALGRLLDGRTIGALTAAVAIHFMDRDALVRASYRYAESSVRYDAPLTVDDMVGGVFSALSTDRLPSTQGRATFAAEVRDALGGRDEVTERVRVWLQFGTPD